MRDTHGHDFDGASVALVRRDWRHSMKLASLRFMILYKYVDEFGLKILEDLRLKITPPNEFNDPFEITPNTKRARPLAEMLANVRPDSKYFRGVYDDMIRDGECTGPFDQ